MPSQIVAAAGSLDGSGSSGCPAERGGSLEMPVYDYACTTCGHRVELIHGRDVPGPSACQQCGGPMRKLISAAAVVFRGSGWAKRDRAVATAPGSAKDDGEAAGPPAKGESAPPASGDASPAPTPKSGDQKAKATPATGKASEGESKHRGDGRERSKGSAPAAGSGSD